MTLTVESAFWYVAVVTVCFACGAIWATHASQKTRLQMLDILNAICHRDITPIESIRLLSLFNEVSFFSHYFYVATMRDPRSLYPSDIRRVMGWDNNEPA